MDDIFYGTPEKEFNTYDQNLGYAIQQVKIEGLFLEFGVYNGRTLNQIHDMSGGKIVYGFDSFEGLPEEWNGLGKGFFKTTKPTPINDKVILVDGLFEETLPKFNKSTVAFMHVDCDIYSAAKTVFDNFKDHIVSGTVIVFDEYYSYPDFRDHEYKAFKEFLEQTGKKCRPLGVVLPDGNACPASFIIL